MNDSTSDNNRSTKVWFFFTTLYLVIDYGRPQDLFSVDFLRLGMIINIILIYFIITRGNLLIFQIKQIRFLIYFFILLLLFVPFARNNYYAFKTAYGFFLYLPFIFSIVFTINSVNRLKIFIITWLIITIYLSIYGIFNKGYGPGNYFADENDMSLYLNMILPFFYFLFLEEKIKYLKFFYLIGLILCLSTIIISFSRGGFVGLLAVGIFIWLVSPRKYISLFIILIIAVMLFYFVDDKYWSEMSTITNMKESTVNERIISWETAWKMFLDHPFGVGGNNFQILFPQYQPSDYRNMWGRVAHSLWFTLLADLGIIGVIIYLLLLYYNLKSIISIIKNRIFNKINFDLRYIYYISLSILAALAGFFASGTFLSVLYYAHYFYMTAVIIAIDNIYQYKLLNIKDNDYTIIST